MIRVRAEMTQDIGDIHMVNRLAFGQEDEASLVQRIRKSSNFMTELSLVAEKGAQNRCGDRSPRVLSPVWIRPCQAKKFRYLVPGAG